MSALKLYIYVSLLIRILTSVSKKLIDILNDKIGRLFGESKADYTLYLGYIREHCATVKLPLMCVYMYICIHTYTYT